MKKFLSLGFMALMMLFAMPSIVRADEDEEPTTPATALTSPTFTPASGATITPQSTINFTLPNDLGEISGAFILYVENKPDVTLETTKDILEAAAMAAMGNQGGGVGGGPTFAAGDDASDDLEYEIAVYADLGDGLICLKPVTISTESGTVAFRARLAIISSDDDGNDIVQYSDEMTATYTVEGEVVVVKPTAPTFSPASGALPLNTKVTLDNGYNGNPIYPIYYTTIEGNNTDFLSITTYEALGNSEDLEEYDENERIKITKGMTIRAATAEINAQDQSIIWSDIVSATYTIRTATPTFKVGDEAKTSYELAADGDASVTVTIVAAEGASVYYTTDGSEPTTELTAATSNEVVITSACTLKAIAQKTGEDKSEVASFTVTKAGAVTPTPEVVTFTISPEPTAEGLDAGTEITVACSDADLDIYYQWFATKEAADAATTLEDGEWTWQTGTFVPVLTAEKPVLKVFAVDDDENIKADSVVVYTVKAGETPVAPANYFTLSPAPTEPWEAGTEIEVTYVSEEEGPFINFKWFATEAAARAEEFDDTDATWEILSEDNKVTLTAEKPVLRLIMSTFTDILADSVVVYTIEKPTGFAVAALGGEMNNDTVVITGVSASFRVYMHVSKSDKTEYVIESILTKNDAEVAKNMGNASDTLSMFTNLMAGLYKATFRANAVNATTGAWDLFADTAIYCRIVEPEYVDPEFTVAVAADSKSEMDADTVVFEGMAAFELGLEGELAEGDGWSNYQVRGTLMTKAGDTITTNWYDMNEEDGTRAEFVDSYDGEYMVNFLLSRRSTNAVIADTTVYFNVTEYAEPILPVDPELTVTPAGKHEMMEDTVVFNVPAFLIQIDDKDLIEGDTLSNYTLTYEFGPKDVFDFVEGAEGEMTEVVCAADTMDGKTITFGELEEGEYAVYIYLTRTNGQLPDILENSYTIYFNVTTEELGVEANTELAGVNVYPNPSNGTFNVAVPEKARIEIFGLNGAKVMSREANAGVESFNINRSGIYFVRVMAGNKTAVKRVVVL